MGPAKHLARAVGLQAGEGARTARLFAFIFLLTLAIVFGKSAQRGIFLGTQGRAQIPNAFLFSALTLATLSLLISALAGRMRPSQLVQRLLVAVALALLVGRASLELHFAGAPLLVYVLVEAAAGLVLVQGWTVTTEVLDVRSAKRLLPLVGTGSGLAWMLGGAAVRPLVSVIGTPALLVVAAVLLMGAAALVGLIALLDLADKRPARPPSQAGAAAATRPSLLEGLRSGLAFIVAEPLLRVLAVVAICDLLVEQVLEFQLMAAAQERYASRPDGIAGFMGLMYGVVGVITLVTPFLMSGRLISRLGSTRATMLAPVWEASLAIAFFIWPTLGVVVAMSAGDRVWKQSLSSPGRAQMQAAIPASRRAQAGALLKGVIAPVFYAGGSAALRLLPPGAHPRWLSLATVALALTLLLVSGRWLGRAYLGALRRSVDGRRLDLSTARRIDREQCMAFADELHAADPARATFAVTLLAAAGPEDRSVVQPLLRRACSDAAPTVRAAAVLALGGIGDRTDAAAIAAILDGVTDEELRTACLRALAALPPTPPTAGLRAIAVGTSGGDLRGRALACACIARAGGDDERAAFALPCTEGEGEGRGAFARLLESPDEQERAAAAWALGEARLDLPQLTALVADSSTSVRREALRAAGRLGTPAAVRFLADALEDPQVALAAADGIARLEDVAMPHLAPSLLADAPPKRITRAAAALARSAGPQGDALLVNLLDHSNRLVRHRAAKALVARHARVENRAFDRLALEKASASVETELRIGHEYYALRLALAGGAADFAIAPELGFIAGEIEGRIRQTERRLLGLLALVGDPSAARLVETNLREGDPRATAGAIELLEHVLPPAVARRALPFLERRPLVERADAVRAQVGPRYLADPLPCILELDDPHLRRCALHAWRERAATEFPDALTKEGNLLALVERIQLLRSVPLFRDLSGEDLMHVAEIAAAVEYPQGAVIFRKGDVGDALYVLIRGRVSVRDGAQLLQTLGTTEFFGELAVLDDEPRSADAVCDEDALLLRLAGLDFEELMERRPPIAREIIRVLTQRLRKANQRR